MSLNQEYISKLLEEYNVPGISFAVTKNFKLNYAQTLGLSNSDTNEKIWTDTLFQAASISKTLTTLAIMQMREEKLIDIDLPINNYLKLWKIPENKWTKAKPVTARHLLSHFGGVNVPTYRGYVKGETIPSLIEILEGDKNTNSAPVRVDMPVDENFSYSTGAFAILQLAIEEICNNSFESVMQERIFMPLDMKFSTFSSPLPADIETLAASGHRKDSQPVAGSYFIYPEQAGSSLWTNPVELAKLAVHLQTILKTGEPGIISATSLKEILLPYKDNFFGLGYALYFDKGEHFYFGHTGNTEGFRSMFIANSFTGNGAFILVNSDNADPVIKGVINEIARTENWNGFSW